MTIDVKEYAAKLEHLVLVEMGWRMCQHNAQQKHLWNAEIDAGTALYPQPSKQEQERLPIEPCKWHRKRK
jgi:hypothetical protein